MGYIILALALILGSAANTKELAVLNMQQDLITDQNFGSEAWLAYRTAVQYYVEQHPGFTGSLDLSDLGMSDKTQILPNAGNSVIKDDTGTKIVTWMPLSPNILADTIRLADGDRSIGIAHNTSWSTPFFGDMGELPIPVPEGDIVSVVSFTGPGF